MSEFLHNDDESLLSAMDRCLRHASRARWAIAYVRESFLQRLSAPLNDFERRGGRLRLLTGHGQGFTEAGALELLQSSAHIDVRVYAANGVTFHPKLYLFGNGDQAAIIGSPNLSDGAFSSNVEAAVEITSAADPSFLQRSSEWFEYVWRRSTPLTPTLIAWFRAHERVADEDGEFTRAVREEAERYGTRDALVESIFQLNREYTNDEVSKIAHVSTQGGIRYRGSTSTQVERCVVVSGSEKGEFYDDRWEGHDHLRYTGEGRSGDQELVRGNLVLSRQAELGFPLHVFLKLGVNRYRYAGQFKVLATIQDAMPGEDGRTRRVYRFELERLG